MTRRRTRRLQPPRDTTRRHAARLAAPCARGCLVAAAIGLASAAFAGCGKKGPPLAPLRLVPGAVSEMDARRTGPSVELRFGLPTANANGPGPVDLRRVEVYAITVGPGVSEPANRDLLNRQRLVGSIEVRPPAVEGESTEPAAPAPADTRPAPGERVTFVEELTEAKLKPVVTAVQAPDAGAAGTGTAAGAPSAVAGTPTAAAGAPPAAAGTPPVAAPAGGAPAPPVAPGGGVAAPAPAPGVQAAPGTAPKPPPPDPRLASAPMRVYGVRGITRGGRPGQPVRVRVPLIDTAAPPTGVAARFTERTIALDWTPPIADVGGPPPAFNVYPATERAGALNPSPLAAASFEYPIPELGKEQCFVVRTVRVIGAVSIESASSAPACTTPLDIFAPAAPAGLQAVPTAEGVSLSWEATAAPDLAGYVLLRGDAPGGTLQPLTREPIRETTYRDATAKPGATYVYAVVAVDKASPPNTSARSEPATVTAR